MGAPDDLRREGAKLEAMTADVFAGVVLALHASIKEGSAVTAAPGQPVDTGRLRNSWAFEFDGPTRAAISTDVEYAQAVEDGVGPHGPVAYGKSGVGGSHSVALTIAGAARLVDREVQRASARRGDVIDERSGFRGEDGG
jgi:hypothetical protein